MGSNLSISSLERHDQLVDFISRRQRVTVAEIAERFAISVATVRRDLDVLAEQGDVERFHGGARISHTAPPELPVLQRQTVQARAKRNIGQAAAELVQDGDTVCLGSGTTTLQVANHLRNHRNLTIITNSVLVINALSDVPDITIVGLGGLMRQSEMSLIGHITERGLAEVHADKVIMGIRAIDIQHGLTNDYLPETMTDRAVLGIGREVIIVADHSKCGRVSTAFVAPVTAVHTLVTDNKAPADFTQDLEELGVRIIQVSSESE